MDDDLYVGKFADDDVKGDDKRDFCDVDAGFVVSQSVLKSFKNNLVKFSRILINLRYKCYSNS